MNQLLNDYPRLKQLFCLIGLLVVSRKALNILRFVYQNFLRRRQNLAKKYGSDSWVLITGASDGIGKQIAIQLCSQGFNIILVARNMQKLQKVQQELLKVNSQRKSEIVQCDFKDCWDDLEFFDNIMDQVGHLDISMLVNNVGVDAFELLHQTTDKDVKNILTINCLPMTQLTKLLIPQLRKRGRGKSAIINVTSLAGEFPTAYFSVYGASKAYGDFLSQTISYEYPEIDIISLKPSEVSTNMTFNRPPDILTITIVRMDCSETLGMKEAHMVTGGISYKRLSIVQFLCRYITTQ